MPKGFDRSSVRQQKAEGFFPVERTACSVPMCYKGRCCMASRLPRRGEETGDLGPDVIRPCKAR